MATAIRGNQAMMPIIKMDINNKATMMAMTTASNSSMVEKAIMTSRMFLLELFIEIKLIQNSVATTMLMPAILTIKMADTMKVIKATRTMTTMTNTTIKVLPVSNNTVKVNALDVEAMTQRRTPRHLVTSQ